MSDCRKCASFDWCAENEDCFLFNPKSQTNADRIRSMSDVELADFLRSMEQHCPDYKHIENCTKYYECTDCWLDWLKQEVET